MQLYWNYTLKTTVYVQAVLSKQWYQSFEALVTISTEALKMNLDVCPSPSRQMS